METGRLIRSAKCFRHSDLSEFRDVFEMSDASSALGKMYRLSDIGYQKEDIVFCVGYLRCRNIRALCTSETVIAPCLPFVRPT